MFFISKVQNIVIPVICAKKIHTYDMIEIYKTRRNMKTGHLFLKDLGKTRLRPGGIKATSWLMEHSSITKDSEVLEVACNMGTTLIEIANKYNCNVTGIDLSAEAIVEANNNIQAAGLTNAQVIVANATKLPFDDNSFDVIINEAMLTMLPYTQKQAALSEYYRVLKPGGKLLTHDIAINNLNDNKSLGQNAVVPANALEQNGWMHLIGDSKLQVIDYDSDPMSLMSPIGLIRDEGLFGAIKIVKNGLKKQNRKQFIQMFKHFRRQRKNLNYIAICSEKKENNANI